jgi:hypothetical protein
MRQISKIGAVALIACCLSVAQHPQKPLTNADVIKMVKGGVPEPVIVSAIQASKGKFDTSTNALIAMQKAGVTQAVMDAIIASSKTSSAVTTPPANAPVAQAGGSDAEPASSGAKLRMPKSGCDTGRRRSATGDGTNSACTNQNQIHMHGPGRWNDG